MPAVRFVPAREIARVEEGVRDLDARLAVLADLCRLNTLAAIQRAGSGHIGTSFSAMEILAVLYWSVMDARAVDDPERDIAFSSKGHDVPGHYAVLNARGLLPREKLLDLRRIAGVPGHPDVETPGIEANTGSLGMGISKGKGFAWAKALAGRGGRVFVITGDGELQEGQIWESLQTTASQRIANVRVIVDHNKVQSDTLVSEVTELGDLEAKFRAFGWWVARCDGHDVPALRRALSAMEDVRDRPRILIADTIKGKGVSFMEHPAALAADAGMYRWHSGAPGEPAYANAVAELTARIDRALAAHGLAPLALDEVASAPANPPPSDQSVAAAYGDALVELAREGHPLVVLDADLATDCKLRGFQRAFPERYIENGIAEQDMVSMAGALALAGHVPVVNSFGSFLCARANEQIYNNATEKTRVVHAAHYAGLLPAGPGHSHQCVRDISLFGALPAVTILQPATPAQSRLALRWLATRAPGPGLLRLQIGPSPRAIALPDETHFVPGQGQVLMDGSDAVLFAYGPVMVAQALGAAERLARDGFALKVVATAWLNLVDEGWLDAVLLPGKPLWVLEDHAPVGGLGDRLAATLSARQSGPPCRIRILGVEGVPACGTPAEALAAHGLDAESLARRIRAG